MKQLRYRGEFVSISGTVWRAEILQDASVPYDVTDIEFDANEPVLIEWSRKDKEEVIQSSAATIRIISETDREFIDLYSEKVGAIRLDIYKDNSLYWSGTLDTEFYEEPYECASGYTVTFTFSDFGILDRLKYNLTGMQTLRAIITDAINRAGINYSSINTDYVSTSLPNSGSISGGALSINSENFIDEDGEHSTLDEAVEGVLQPLAIRLIQRGGIVYLYDLNGLYTLGTEKTILWDGDSQTLGVDKVANNVVINFSPYSQAKALSSDIDYKGEFDVSHTNLTNNAPQDPEYGDYYSYYPDYSKDHQSGGSWDYNLINFTIFLSDKGDGVTPLGGCRFFHVLPLLGGASESSGVAYAFRTGGHGALSTGWPQWKEHTSVPRADSGQGSVLRSKRVYFPKLSSTDASKYKIRLNEEILLDVRYNPFSGSTEGNEEGNDETFKRCSAFVFIPVLINLYDENGAAIYHYCNSNAAHGAVIGHLGWAEGTWVAGAASYDDCWLEYYNPKDLKEDCGLRGWHGNRHCIGRPDGKHGRISAQIYESFAQMSDGEYLPYPPVAGSIEIEVLAGVYGYDYGQKVDECDFGSLESQWDKKEMYNRLRWCLYKAPSIELVNNNLVFDSAELDDIEYNGELNADAKEEVGIDTICGTSMIASPTARGIYYDSTSGLQIQKLSRAGITDHPEKLLIGTLYSQYADRKTTLLGEAVIESGLNWYTEQNQGGKRFLLMSDAQNLRTDCTDAEYCEFRPDEYDSKN